MATFKHHEEIVAWQLSEELRQKIAALIEKPKVARCREFCDQIRRSSASAAANISEGFWKYRPREFARYMRNALGSLGETQNHLRRALNDKAIEQEDFDPLWVLSWRAIKTSSRLHSYLRQCPDKDRFPPEADGDDFNRQPQNDEP